MDEKNSAPHRERVEESNLGNDITEPPFETDDNYHGRAWLTVTVCEFDLFLANPKSRWLWRGRHPLSSILVRD